MQWNTFFVRWTEKLRPPLAFVREVDTGQPTECWPAEIQNGPFAATCSRRGNG